MMSLTADHNSNRLTGQGNYDGAGNFLGNSQYSYDILNRLSATGTSSYTYSPGTNKRMAVYSSSGTSAQAVFHIYDPNGRKIGEYTYTATAPWSRAQFQPGLSKDIWYLGSKRVDMSEDQVGSNWDQTQYYPWGQVQAGQQPSETQGFGTYVLDGGSGLYYADQRYYNQSWGRFLTADPTQANVDLTNPISWNHFAYANGDPANSNDPLGTSDCPGDSCDDDRDGSANCDPSDATIDACPGEGQGDGAIGSGVVTSPMTLAEADQFETLEQQGVISGFENTTTGIAISISPGAWGGIADLCLLQPEICVAGAFYLQPTLYTGTGQLSLRLQSISMQWEKSRATNGPIGQDRRCRRVYTKRSVRHYKRSYRKRLPRVKERL